MPIKKYVRKHAAIVIAIAVITIIYSIIFSSCTSSANIPENLYSSRAQSRAYKNLVGDISFIKETIDAGNIASVDDAYFLDSNIFTLQALTLIVQYNDTGTYDTYKDNRNADAILLETYLFDLLQTSKIDLLNRQKIILDFNPLLFIPQSNNGGAQVSPPKNDDTVEDRNTDKKTVTSANETQNTVQYELIEGKGAILREVFDWNGFSYEGEAPYQFLVSSWTNKAAEEVSIFRPERLINMSVSVLNIKKQIVFRVVYTIEIRNPISRELSAFKVTYDYRID